ncbi:uncharacterized protein LOC111052038 [Nilaparvata lugens]|uniref:uncharacterized protein LOC111052038 n=1 Tax=Nilaparvata lugens TaxID=108931 RepID=UPI000B994ED0|nr:uncharacterized protein LOC111052038 [Nilaparvata lugens]
MMDEENYEELQESLVYYRTKFCKRVVQTTAKKLKLQECDLMLNMKPVKAKKIKWKYDPSLKQNQIFEGELGCTKKGKSGKPEGSNNNQSNDSEKLSKVTKMMKKMKYLKEVSEIDQTLQKIPDEVKLEELHKRFGVQVS